MGYLIAIVLLCIPLLILVLLFGLKVDQSTWIFHGLLNRERRVKEKKKEVLRTKEKVNLGLDNESRDKLFK